MGKTRQVEVPGGSSGEPEIIEMTNLEWSIQFVMLKIQEMVRSSNVLVRIPASLSNLPLDIQWQKDGPVWYRPLRDRR